MTSFDTPGRIRRPLNPYDRFDLQKFVLHLDDIPPPPRFTPGNLEAVSGWIQGVGPIETSEIREIHSLILQLLRTNSASINGARLWAGIDGPPLSGKTFATIVAALRIGEHLRLTQGDDVSEPFEHIPVAVVSGDLGNTALARTLLDNIARFIGVPLPPSLPAAIAHLARRLREVGTLLVVVDDAHFIKRKNGSRSLTDDLKDIVTTLPVSFVFVGAGLRSSALLHVPDCVSGTQTRRLTPDKERFEQEQFSAVHQLRERMIFRSVRIHATRSGTPHKVLRNRISRMVDQFDRIDGFDPSILRDERVITAIAARSHGKTGHSLKLCTEIANSSVLAGESPTLLHVSVATRVDFTNA